METVQIKGKYTNKKVCDFLNKEFKKLDMNDYIVTDVRATRFRPQDYEGGACKLIITVANKADSEEQRKKDNTSFMSFYSIKELEMYSTIDYEMYITTLPGSYRVFCIDNLELSVRKKL